MIEDGTIKVTPEDKVEQQPHILIESKSCGASSWKITRVIGDIDAKRSDTAFLFFTNGVILRHPLEGS